MGFPELDPFSIQNYLQILISIPIFYFFGLFIVSRRENNLLSVALRVAIGCIFFISILATIYSSGNTGFLFYLVLLVFLMLKRRFSIDIQDVKGLGLKPVLVFFTISIALISVEALRADVRMEEGVYVGNSDVAHYASYGISMFRNGLEANPEKITPLRNPVLYHFGDIWLAGAYAYFFKTLPYYSYMLIGRVVMILVTGLLLFAWVKAMTNNTVISLITALLFLFAVYFDLPAIPGQLDIFKGFTFKYPAFCNPSHLIVALGMLTFIILMETDPLEGITGVWFTPFFNAGIVLAPPVAAVVFFVLSVIRIIWAGQKLSQNVLVFHGFSVLFSLVPLVFHKLTGRFVSGAEMALDVSQLYVSFHTLVRAVLSYAYISPFLVGLIFFAKGRIKFQNDIFYLALSFAVGILVSFSIIFPLVQGNSVKILSIHFTALLAPIGLVGLSNMVRSFGVGMKALAVTCLILISGQTVRVWAASQGFALLYDWSTYLPDYQHQTMVSNEDYEFLHDHLGTNSNVGYFRHEEDGNFGGVQYSEFTHLKGLFSGVVFFRMNASAKDTLISAEQLGYYKQTALGYFSVKNEFDSVRVSNDMLEFIRPSVILRPVNDLYVFPNSLKDTYPKVFRNESYYVYEK
jgi:hypothetical protein